jgi:hypothetical protein
VDRACVLLTGLSVSTIERRRRCCCLLSLVVQNPHNPLTYFLPLLIVRSRQITRRPSLSIVLHSGLATTTRTQVSWQYWPNPTTTSTMKSATAITRADDDPLLRQSVAPIRNGCPQVGAYARNCVPPRLRQLPASSSTLLLPTSLIFGFLGRITRWFGSALPWLQLRCWERSLPWLIANYSRIVEMSLSSPRSSLLPAERFLLLQVPQKDR